MSKCISLDKVKSQCCFCFTFMFHATFELYEKGVAFIWPKEIVTHGSSETNYSVYVPISLVLPNFVTLYVIWLLA